MVFAKTSTDYANWLSKARARFAARLFSLCVKAVNEHGGFGNWGWAVSRQLGDVVGVLEQTL